MRRIGLLLDDISLEHAEPHGHPERAERLRAIAREVDAGGFWDRALRVRSRPATRAELAAAHASPLLDRLEKELPGNEGHVDGDTYFAKRSWEAALHAAGGAVTLVERALRGDIDAGAALVRPPGHHATGNRPMGFCLLNNVAVAAQAARALGARRVAVMDWDLHHGNGTQDIFWQDPGVLYLSTHQYPFYPGTGAVDEVGEGPGRGYTVNVPLPAGAGDAEYEHVFARAIAPALRAYGPDLLLISAGFDAHVRDPLGQMRLSTGAFFRLTHRLRAAVGAAPVVAVLEGGYDLEGLASSTRAMLEALEGPVRPPDEAADPHPAAPRVLAALRAALVGTALAGALEP